MRLKEYFANEPFILHSSLSPDKVVDRINEAAGSIYWPFNFGVVGRARSGRIRLQFRSSPFEYNAKPVLVGDIQDATSGSTLTLRYRAPALFYAFFIFWYALLALVALGFVANAVTGNVPVRDLAFAFAVIAGLFLAPLGMHYVGTRNSGEELSELLDFLAREAEARSQ